MAEGFRDGVAVFVSDEGRRSSPASARTDGSDRIASVRGKGLAATHPGDMGLDWKGGEDGDGEGLGLRRGRSPVPAQHRGGGSVAPGQAEES